MSNPGANRPVPVMPGFPPTPGFNCFRYGLPEEEEKMAAYNLDMQARRKAANDRRRAEKIAAARSEEHAHEMPINMDIDVPDMAPGTAYPRPERKILPTRLRANITSGMNFAVTAKKPEGAPGGYIHHDHYAPTPAPQFHVPAVDLAALERLQQRHNQRREAHQARFNQRREIHQARFNQRRETHQARFNQRREGLQAQTQGFEGSRSPSQANTEREQARRAELEQMATPDPQELAKWRAEMLALQRGV